MHSSTDPGATLQAAQHSPQRPQLPLLAGPGKCGGSDVRLLAPVLCAVRGLSKVVSQLNGISEFLGLLSKNSNYIPSNITLLQYTINVSWAARAINHNPPSSPIPIHPQLDSLPAPSIHHNGARVVTTPSTSSTFTHSQTFATRFPPSTHHNNGAPGVGRCRDHALRALHTHHVAQRGVKRCRHQLPLHLRQQPLVVGHATPPWSVDVAGGPPPETVRRAAHVRLDAARSAIDGHQTVGLFCGCSAHSDIREMKGKKKHAIY